MNVILIIIVSFLSCAAQLCQKHVASIGISQGKKVLWLWILLNLFLLGVGMLLWLNVLRKVPVSIAYPMLSMNFIFVALAARWIWKEKFTRQRILGVLMIVVGVSILGIFT